MSVSEIRDRRRFDVLTSRDRTETGQHGGKGDHGVQVTTGAGRRGVDEDGDEDNVGYANVCADLIGAVAEEGGRDLARDVHQAGCSHELDKLRWSVD